jgi:hypothetical protein
VRSDKRNHFPGVDRACRFQQGVILTLLTMVPLRQRNVREMQWDKHLFQQDGDWLLRFQGADLKVPTRKGRTNILAYNLSKVARDFLPVLEEWRRDFRPKLPGAETSPFVFLTRFGNPFSQRALTHELSEVVAMHTGKRFYPHLIRTIWASEYIAATGDYEGAAAMLGDRTATLFGSYHYIEEEQAHARAAAWRDERRRRTA